MNRKHDGPEGRGMELENNERDVDIETHSDVREKPGAKEISKNPQE